MLFWRPLWGKTLTHMHFQIALFLRMSFVHQSAHLVSLGEVYLPRCSKVDCDQGMKKQAGMGMSSEVFKSSRNYVRNCLETSCSPWKSQYKSYQNVLGAKRNSWCLPNVCSLASIHTKSMKDISSLLRAPVAGKEDGWLTALWASISPSSGFLQHILAVEVILALFFVCSLMLNKVSGNLLELFTELFTWSYRADRQSPKFVFSC